MDIGIKERSKSFAIMNTEVPGPQSREYLKEQHKKESTAITYPRNLPIAVKRAYGPIIEDVDGNQFIDFLSGAGVLALGHSHPELISAVEKQLRLFSHGLDLPTPVKHKFTDAVLGILPQKLQQRMRIHFCGPTGADGIETALKIAKSHTGRGNVISFHGAYHGCTNGAMSVTSKVGPKNNVQNLMPGVHFFPFPYCFRCPLGLNKNSCNTNCIQYLENMLCDSHSGITKPAAILIESLQGEGGSIPINREFFQRLRLITNELDIPLIIDEVQTGVGRTGTWLAFEQYDIEPDMVVLSKALGGIGSPISVVLYKKDYEWAAGAHVGTFRGNQLAMAAGLQAIEIIRRDNVLLNVNMLSELGFGRLRTMLSGVSHVGEIRGCGLMIGIEMINPNTMEPNGEQARKVQATCLQTGLIIELGGRKDSVIRVLPPLNIDKAIFMKGIDILIYAIQQCET